jgi:hypothetical protein
VSNEPLNPWTERQNHARAIAQQHRERIENKLRAFAEVATITEPADQKRRYREP